MWDNIPTKMIKRGIYETDYRWRCEKYARELKALVDSEDEPPEESVPENEIIDMTSDNVVVFLKKNNIERIWMLW